MASLVKIKSLIAPLTTKHNRVIYNVIRTKVMTNYDYMPGPRPTNEEEHKKAAEKYGLHPAEYKLYPDDGMYPLGDYPQLPYQPVSARDPYYPWDQPDEKRNYNEPIHAEINLLNEDRTDYGEKPYIGYWTAPLAFWGFVAVYCFLNYIADKYPLFRPVLEKQIPQPGVVHYTFEPANHK
ncbi:NADH dehydrogenase [ubiquinone] 1 beta subcomplex subunit 8, mitochondrial [Microplitis mediator]|uniref:NADH dehydrogenase [ubiquinone] 1 beta subcomplex subunit 8, mitochondrial n=1 Tax=Microplitis mediator TaxID=375433 RepID=UPI002553F6DD|nr:NADH dehydrogenase [ubiquinone] 1 beta subcomplex subunit 8, mitochondrial [Microplitis mediator]